MIYTDDMTKPVLRGFTLSNFQFGDAVEMAKTLDECIDMRFSTRSGRPSVKLNFSALAYGDGTALLFHKLFNTVQRYMVGMPKTQEYRAYDQCSWNLYRNHDAQSSSADADKAKQISAHSLLDAVRIYYLSLFVLTTVSESRGFYVKDFLPKEAGRLGK